ncbi:unnamed protein product, partial [marine sediment metagenome]
MAMTERLKQLEAEALELQRQIRSKYPMHVPEPWPEELVRLQGRLWELGYKITREKEEAGDANPAMGKEHEAQMQRNKHLGTLADTVKDNLGDGISALKVAAEEIKGSGTKAPVAKQPQLYECCQCHEQFGVPPGEWAKVACPKC